MTYSMAFFCHPQKLRRTKEKIMADYANRVLSNAPGKWYVDSTCIDCDLCRETAPGILARDDDAASSIVVRQPETESDERNAQEALDGCPTNSIGNDGPKASAPNGHASATGTTDAGPGSSGPGPRL